MHWCISALYTVLFVCNQPCRAVHRSINSEAVFLLAFVLHCLIFSATSFFLLTLSFFSLRYYSPSNCRFLPQALTINILFSFSIFHTEKFFFILSFSLFVFFLSRFLHQLHVLVKCIVFVCARFFNGSLRVSFIGVIHICKLCV